MNELQPIVTSYLLEKPSMRQFPYNAQGQKLVEFIRAVCDEHKYQDINDDLDLVEFHAVNPGAECVAGRHS